ncbi:HaaA family cyclophane-containing RiPP peptide [Streptomyces sp. NPDC046182]|uniref:HaaA family cyclophane-containing RiPP peptide n=1 Tax=Streptomyces sp. NPDC046182 TaxID=3154601 RepID=UPI0033EC8E87
MSSRTSLLAPPACPESIQGNAVLERIAARVQQRLDEEKSTADGVAEGPHAASLIWPWWF